MKTTLNNFAKAGYVVVKNVDSNPYREGTNRHKRFAAYRNGRSIAATLADKRVKRDGFRRDINTGVVRLVKRIH